MRPGYRQRESGVSAIELMIGMLLGLILIGGAISIFLASKRSYTEVEQVSGLAENAQFAERLLTDSIRHIGFFGEVPANLIERDAALTAVVNDCSGNAAAYDLENYIFAAVADGGGNAVGCVTDAVPGTHVLVTKSVFPRPFTDGPRDDPTQRNGTIDTPSTLRDDQTYIMTNDIKGIMFDGADKPAPNANVLSGGAAWAYRFQVYYVRQGQNGGPPTLSRMTLALVGGAMQVVPEDLVEGVEDLRLRFGLDAGADGEVDTYTTIANMAGNWGRVGSVEISLLVRSVTEDPNYINPNSYAMGGANVTPADDEKHYRRVLVTNNMSLRNPELAIRGGGL